MIIPRGVVEKWGGNRIGKGYTPESLAEIADEVYHSPDVKVSEGNYPHIQKLLKEREGHNNDFVGFISQNPKTGDTVAKTIYQKEKRGSVGRYNPTSLQDNPAGSMRQSLLYEPLSSKSISHLGEIVKGNDVISDVIKKVNSVHRAMIARVYSELKARGFKCGVVEFNAADYFNFMGINGFSDSPDVRAAWAAEYRKKLLLN